MPDIVIVGAARSGTSFLSGSLGTLPNIDAGSVKEPNFFSSRWESGADWYDGLYQPRNPETRRVDASVSYTYPQHTKALERIGTLAPDVQIVYLVRAPLSRLVSHHQLFAYYYGTERPRTLEEHIEYSAMYLGAGDYEMWLGRIQSIFGVERVLVAPFPAVTTQTSIIAGILLSRVGLSSPDDLRPAQEFRNEVREFRIPGLQAAQTRIHRSRLYPHLRKLVGAERLRALRAAATRPTTLPSVQETLDTLSPGMWSRVKGESERAASAARAWLVEQDGRLGMNWTDLWDEHLLKEPTRGAA